MKFFLALGAAGFLLRIFYAGHLYQDDGLWFTAGEELLEGKVLYRDIYFDKPPVLPLVYGGLFALFGAHVLTIRLFTIVYAVAVSALLYRFGARLYGERTGMVAAAFFTVFSTTFTTGHVQGLNSDFLMALPYTAAAYGMMMAARRESVAWRPALFAGIAAGIAFQTNPKGIFALLFFAAVIAKVRWRDRRKAAELLIAGVAGFAAGALPFWIYIAASGGWENYRADVWDWGGRYAAYYSWRDLLVTATQQTVNYFAVNLTLLIGLAVVAAKAAKQWRRAREEGVKPAMEAGLKARSEFEADAALLIWLAVSYFGMAVGGRFFGHYFFQIMPALCMIGARGILELLRWRRSPARGARQVWMRRGALALLIVGLMVTLARFHVRTAQLAIDYARGEKGAATRDWLHERLNREERLVAARVLGREDGEALAENFSGESLRDGGPRFRAVEGPSDYLFVWGYRPEIYYWSGLLPASRYLSTQPLTGVPADVHYFGESFRSVLDEAAAAAARARLLEDLRRTNPRYIIDELGFFNSNLAMEDYPELREFLKGYRNLGVTGRFFVYRRKEKK